MHDYNCRLLDRWGSGSFNKAARVRALNPEAYHKVYGGHGDGMGWAEALHRLHSLGPSMGCWVAEL